VFSRNTYSGRDELAETCPDANEPDTFKGLAGSFVVAEDDGKTQAVMSRHRCVDDE
jgi:hypothetical protein